MEDQTADKMHHSMSEMSEVEAQCNQKLVWRQEWKEYLVAARDLEDAPEPVL